MICDLCGNPDSIPFLQLPDYYLHGTRIVSNLVQCTQCSLIYQCPQLTDDEIDQYYPDTYPPFNLRTHQDSRRSFNWFSGPVFRDKRQLIVKTYKARGTILDLGCASGQFLQQFQQDPGWELHGVEPNSKAYALASRNKRLNLVHGQLESGLYPQEFFDVVTAWDVLEHLKSPRSTMMTIREILKTDGMLFMRVPNQSSRDFRWFGPYWAGLDAPRHRFVFNTMTIMQLMQTTGFEMVAMSSHVGYYLNFIKSIQFALLSKPRLRAGKKVLLQVLKSLPVRLLAAPLFYSLGKGEKGSELVIAARKNKSYDRNSA